MSFKNRRKTHVPSTRCITCKRNSAFPGASVSQLDPWMVDMGLHMWCALCMDRLADRPDKIRAMYDLWQKECANILSSAAAEKAKRLGARAEKIVPDDVFDRDGWVCQLCKEPVSDSLPQGDKMGPSLDHIIPLSAGGTHTWGNVQLAHRSCNSRKGARLALSKNDAA